MEHEGAIHRDKCNRRATPGPLGSFAMKRRGMNSVLMLFATSAILLLGSSRSEGGPEDLKPGDANYPAENAHPVRIAQFTAVLPSWLHVHFNLVYMPALSGNWKPGEAPCSHLSRDGVAAVYSVSVPLVLSVYQDQAAQGQSYRGTFAVDRFKPGRCQWELVEVRYSIDANGGEDFRLIRYDPTTNGNASDSVELWCTRVPADYRVSHPPSRLRAVACHSEYLDKKLLLKRAAVAGSGSWGWTIEGAVSGLSITAFFRDPDVPVPPPNLEVP